MISTRDYYVAFWTAVLSEFLGWDTERIRRWTEEWNDIDRLTIELPARYVTFELLPFDFREWPSRRKVRDFKNDVMHLLDKSVAVTDEGHVVCDWTALRSRLNEMVNDFRMRDTKEYYVRVWTAVLSKLLGWQPEQIRTWMTRWAEQFDDGDAPVYDVAPCWHLAGLFVPKNHWSREQYGRTEIVENFLGRVLESGIVVRSDGTIGCNWELMRTQIAEMLLPPVDPPEFKSSPPVG
jgi:hypothetical protein